METEQTKPVGKFDIDNPKALQNMAFVALAIYTALFIIAFTVWKYHGPTEAGQFGDTFGFVNALFGGLTIAGIFYTIQLQRKELHETKEEFKTQSRVFQQQRFDEFFFFLLKLHREIRQDILNLSYGQSHNPFDYINNRVESNINGRQTIEEKVELIKTSVGEINPNHQVLLRSYFNTFKHMLDQIRYKTQNLKIGEGEYLETIYSTISPDEIRFLLLNCVTHQESIESFKWAGIYTNKMITGVFTDLRIQSLFHERAK